MVVIAWPLLTGSGKEKNASISDRTQAYTTAKNLLVNGADALERILSSYKEVSYFSVDLNEAIVLYCGSGVSLYCEPFCGLTMAR